MARYALLLSPGFAFPRKVPLSSPISCSFSRISPGFSSRGSLFSGIHATIELISVPQTRPNDSLLLLLGLSPSEFSFFSLFILQQQLKSSFPPAASWRIVFLLASPLSCAHSPRRILSLLPPFLLITSGFAWVLPSRFLSF